MPVLDGRYRLDDRIGSGGMSEVWRAHDEVLDRPVAIKLITLPYADPAAAEVIIDQVRTEARAAARLAHPNIASVHDLGLASGPDDPSGAPRTPYIVMELVDGETLARHLRAGPLDWRIAVRVCAEVSAALAAAHLRGIVHRDVKPANILLTPAGVKVLDFGIAAAIGQRDPVADGQVVGTPAFVAPERLNGVGASPATDLYAVGVLLYLCLAARLPWPVRAEPDRPLSHVYRAPEPLPPVPGLPADVAELCLRCLSADPSARPTAVAMALLLAEAVGIQVYVPVAGLPTPRREWEDAPARGRETDGRPGHGESWGGPAEQRPAGRHRSDTAVALDAPTEVALDVPTGAGPGRYRR